ncbi:MAG: hypothetical protein CMF33_08125 [Leeuwenhoekiella sp.]|nr:hypothetical protein [Leeuwenhoekiella sp.]
MQAQLTKITPDYRAFVDDQVLTAGQLNEFLDFFQDQDRLSRVCLSGVGIVCGFEVSTAGTTVILKPGCGITTDGDLIKLLQPVKETDEGESLTGSDVYQKLASQAVHYTHYREFEDSYAKYPYFRTHDGESATLIPLFELKTDTTKETGKDKVLTAEALKDKVVVLYLETYPQTPDICTETNCDNQGERHVVNLRVLLVGESDVPVLLKKDSVYNVHNNLVAYQSLPEIKVPRLLLKPGAKEIKAPPRLDTSALLDFINLRKDLVFDESLIQLPEELQALDSFRTIKEISETPLKLKTDLSIAEEFKPLKPAFPNLRDLSGIRINTSLKSVNTKTYSALASDYRVKASRLADELATGFLKIKENFSQLLDLENIKLNILIENLNVLSRQIPQEQVQYYYDHLADLTAVYNEVRDLILHIQHVCCPPIDAFPKHLLLGKPNTSLRFAKNRHKFYNSPITANGDKAFQKARFLLQKAMVLSESFSLPMQPEVIITPSNNPAQQPEDALAIPFYYKPGEQLTALWDYFKTSVYREKFNLGYHKNFLSKDLTVTNPLAYELTRFNFLRIEGIQGKSYSQALKDLENLKKEYNLAFDVKAININASLEDIDLDAYSCNFDYLATSLKSWMAEQDCLNSEVTSFFSGFNIKDLGSHNYSFEQFGREDLLDKEVVIRPDLRDISKVADDRKAILDYYKIDVESLKKYPRAQLEQLETLLEEIRKKLTITRDTQAVLASYQKQVSSLISKITGGQTDGVIKESLVEDAVRMDFFTEKSTSAKTDMYSSLSGFSEKSTKSSAKDSTVRMKSAYKTIAPLTQEVKVNKTVTESLYTKPEDLGSVVDYVSKDRLNASAVELIRDILRRQKELFPKETPPNPNDLKVGLEIPAGILSRLQLAASHIPPDLESVTKEGKENFVKAMADLCAFVKEARAVVNEIFNNPQVDYTHYGYETIYTFMLDRLQENCCAAEQLEVILEEIEAKKAQILDELIFENFVRKHPGLEHKAGVPMGGTFVMLYAGITREQADSNIAPNTVVADFALPYMCCSDCAPVAFIIPEPVDSASLIVNPDRLCLDPTSKDPVEVIFTVSPPDGEVSLINKTIKGVSIQGTTFRISPPEYNAYDTPVQFSVNGVLTTASLTIIKKPAFEITSLPQEITAAPGESVELKLDIQNTNQFNTNAFEFNWKVGDQELSGKNPTYRVTVPKEFDGSVFEIPVILELKGAVCESVTQESNILIEIRQTEETFINIEPREFCANDEFAYPITVIPEDAEVELGGAGVEQNDKGWTFMPAKAGPGLHQILLKDGKPISVTVQEVPKDFGLKQSFDTATRELSIRVEDPNAKAPFEWFINGKPHEKTEEGLLIIKQSQTALTARVFVDAIIEPCGSIRSEIISIEIPALETDTVETVIAMEETQFCNTDQSTYMITFLSGDSKAKITGEGVVFQNEKWGFIPLGLTPKSYQITPEGGKSITVNVGAPSGRDVILTAKEENGKRVYTSSITDAKASYTWLLDGKALDELKENEIMFALEKPLSAELVVQVSIPPCDNLQSKPIRVEIKPQEPGDPPVDDTTCTDRTTQYLKSQLPALNSLLKGSQNMDLVGAGNLVKELYRDVLADPALLTTGLSSELGQRIQQALDRIHEACLAAKSTEKPLFVRLYIFAQDLFYGVMRCKKSTFWSTTVVAPILTAIEKHFDRKENGAFGNQNGVNFPDNLMSKYTDLAKHFNTPRYEAHFKLLIENIK